MQPFEQTTAAVAAAATAIEAMRSEAGSTPAHERQKRMLLRCALHDLELRYRRLVDLRAALLQAPTNMLATQLAAFLRCFDRFVRAERSHRLDIAASTTESGMAPPCGDESRHGDKESSRSGVPANASDSVSPAR